MTVSVHPPARGPHKARGRPRRAAIRDEDRAFAAPRPADSAVREHQERLLDQGIEETFPASDPVSVHKVERA